MALTEAQQRYMRMLVRRDKLNEEIEQLRERLSKTCKHPEELRSAWVVSNPHSGALGAVVGENCTLCRAANPWGRGWDDRVMACVTLIRECPHPPAACYEYEWEHDNGYGRQKKVTGLRCAVCRAERSWKDMGLWRSLESRERDRADDRY